MLEEHSNILSAANRILAINEELIRVENYNHRLRLELSRLEHNLNLSCDFSSFEDFEVDGINICKSVDKISVHEDNNKYHNYNYLLENVLEKYETLFIDRLEYPYIAIDDDGVVNCFKANPTYDSEFKLWFTQQHDCKYLFVTHLWFGRVTNPFFIGDGLNHYTYGPYNHICIAENEDEAREIVNKDWSLRKIKIHGEKNEYSGTFKLIGLARLGWTKGLRKPMF